MPKVKRRRKMETTTTLSRQLPMGRSVPDGTRSVLSSMWANSDRNATSLPPATTGRVRGGIRPHQRYRHRENHKHKIENPEPDIDLIRGFKTNSGSVLLSHTAARAVPSAQSSLTSVFEMGTGVTSTLSPPENRKIGVVQSGVDLFKAASLVLTAH